MSLNIENFSRELNKLENYVINYIYVKYIKKGDAKLKDDSEYKLYKDKLLNKSRINIINQDDSLKEDLEKIAIEDDERCSYIRNYKNKLIRCKNSIMNKDEDVCKKHLTKPNIYWDNYNILLVLVVASVIIVPQTVLVLAGLDHQQRLV